MPPLRYQGRRRGRCRSVKAAVEVLRPLSRHSRPLSRLSDWRGQVTGEVKAAVEVEVKADVNALSIDHNYADLFLSLLTKVLRNKTKTAKVE
jgi:hypothetical protein